jgi:hypothetical protein
VKYFTRFCCAFAHNFDAHAPRPDVELFDSHCDSKDARMGERHRRHLFSQRLDERNMSSRKD